MRRLMVQVALSTMRLKKASTRHLWEWAARLEAKRGRKVAAVALARKVTGILYANGAHALGAAELARPSCRAGGHHAGAAGRCVERVERSHGILKRDDTATTSRACSDSSLRFFSSQRASP
jgi:hypothetical protein